ncbi:TatD family hydrolase [Oleiagrimonas sp. MCCC 1A03011]|jgi:TatD DNase family protein|uniref:TatD family hydrolase n=1 Tax=Oleiagrimonas sp. MCCC 1A03011 TaxID=1926883 RepID=UPI001F0BAABC|nr:TatD family hydrolase [Oleiagrimonas sp. MCCC 1A03011]
MNGIAITLFDSHTHLDDAAFDADRDAVLRRAAEAGVTEALVAAVTAGRWPTLQAVCARPGNAIRLHPAYGLHPMFMDAHDDADLDALENWLRDRGDDAVAVGECGLDFQVGIEHERQRRFFRHQIGLARELDRPLILHARKAVEEVILTLRHEGPVRGVVHSYGGSVEQARQLWDLGIHIGLGGPVTHERAHKLHRLAASMPLEQLLLETDAPDQPGAAHRHERNEPAYLTEVLDVVARLRDTARATIAAATHTNARRLFGLPRT